MLKPQPSSGYFTCITHLIPTITFEISTSIIPLFQVGKLRHRKSVMYPGPASGFEPKLLLLLTTNLMYHTCSLALDYTKTRETSVEMGENFAQIIDNPQDNPTKRHFILYFTEEKFEMQKGEVTFLRLLGKFMVEPCFDTDQSDL